MTSSRPSSSTPRTWTRAPDDVRREVEERISVLGRNGGYILGPSHAIQAGTPPENVLALFDTAAACPMPSKRRI